MTKIELANELDRLFSLFGKSKDGQREGVFAEILWKKARHYPLEIVADAITQVSESSARMPTILQVLENIKLVSRVQNYAVEIPSCEACNHTGMVTYINKTNLTLYAFSCSCDLGKSFRGVASEVDAHPDNFKKIDSLEYVNLLLAYTCDKGCKSLRDKYIQIYGTELAWGG